MRCPPPSSPASWAFCPSPNLASHTFLRLPRRSPPRSLRTQLAARETRAKVEGTSQLLGTSSPTHRQEKRSSSTVRRGGKDRAAARLLLLNGAVGVGHTDNDAGTELQSASNWHMQRGESISCDLYRYMLISLALKFCKFLVYLATRSHRQVMFGRPARVTLTDDRWTFISMDLSLRTFGAPGIADF